MIKKIFLLALISIAISSCSTYNNGFSKRKYYDFSNGSSSISISKTEVEEANSAAKLSSNKQEQIIENTYVSSSMDIVSNIRKENNVVSKKKMVSIEKKLVKKINQIIVKPKKEIKSPDEKRKGRAWWVWGVFGIVMLIVSLFLGAYIFLIIGIAEIVIAIVDLIRYKKSK